MEPIELKKSTAHLPLSREVVNAVRIVGSNIITRLELHLGVLQKGERTFASIWARWQHDETYRTPQLAHNWSDARVRYLDHIAQFDISHIAPQSQRKRYVNLIRFFEDFDFEQTGGTIMKGTRVPGSKKRTGKSTKVRRQVQVPCIPVLTGSVKTTDPVLDYKSTWHG